jgi:hypothetical protein
VPTERNLDGLRGSVGWPGQRQDDIPAMFICRRCGRVVGGRGPGAPRPTFEANYFSLTAVRILTMRTKRGPYLILTGV